jgi:hypothetical protein
MAKVNDPDMDDSTISSVRHSDFVIPSCFGIRTSSFLMLDHTAPDAPDLAMMREHVNTSVAATKKCAQ